MRALLAATVLVGLLGGCLGAASGGDCRVCHFTELQRGTSTMADAIALMGSPTSVTQTGDGGAIIVWNEWNGPRLTVVKLVFDPQGQFVRRDAGSAALLN